MAIRNRFPTKVPVSMLIISRVDVLSRNEPDFC